MQKKVVVGVSVVVPCELVLDDARGQVEIAQVVRVVSPPTPGDILSNDENLCALDEAFSR